MKLMKKLRMLTPRQAAFGKNCTIPMADSAMQLHPFGGFRHAAWSPLRIPPRSNENSCGCSHSKDLLTGKEDNGKTRILKIYE
jgi:hypothetical protein